MLDRRNADRTTAVVAGVESLLLLGYAVSIAFVAATQGIEGPQDVSSPAGVAVEVAVFAAFAAGVAAIAWGRRSGQSWSGAPFVVVQVLALTVSVPLAFGSGAGVPAGVLTTIGALVGLAALIRSALVGEPTGPDLREDSASPGSPPAQTTIVTTQRSQSRRRPR
jgi:hypothetical protein